RAVPPALNLVQQAVVRQGDSGAAEHAEPAAAIGQGENAIWRHRAGSCKVEREVARWEDECLRAIWASKGQRVDREVTIEHDGIRVGYRGGVGRGRRGDTH